MTNTKNNKAITLIALVITIVVIVIIAAVTISGAMNGGIISKATEATFKMKIQRILEDTKIYEATMIAENDGQDNTFNLNAGDVLKSIIIQDELEDIAEESVIPMKQVSNSVGNKENKYLMILNGELYYVSQPSISNNENQAKWCNDIGIKVYDFTPAVGIKKTNGDYELVNGTYVCTPELSTGLDKSKTRYIYERNSNLQVGTWINKKPDDDWYDYSNQKWANIYVENDGVESYYVWIPRYCYKIDTENSSAGNERMDVKFINTKNQYIDGETGSITQWSELELEGYKIPEAFWWDKNGNGTQDTDDRLSGYWISKYELSESTKYPINYNLTVNNQGFKISNIVIDTDKTIARYTYAINGKIVYSSETPDDYLFSKSIAKKISTINVTALDGNGEIVGSMTKKDEMIEVNAPILTGFNTENTYYVYWDENEIEHNDIPISQAEPEEWYDYSQSKWANIVTKGKDENGNDTLSYFVWIPRYQYKLNTTNETADIKFISGTSTDVNTGYKIPEAFTWKQGEEQKELKGYWISKYELSQ